MAAVPGVLRPDELAAIRATIAAFLPDLATLYASDGATVVLGGMRVRLVNDRSLTSMRNASDFYTLTAAAGTPLAPGQVVKHGDDWYLVAKSSVDTAHTVEEQAMLLALPYEATVTRTVRVATPHGSANGYGEPRTANDATVTTRTIRCGLSNDNNPLIVQDIGNMPRGVTTAYCPLGSDVRLGDALLLPDGSRLAVDQQRNLLTANGTMYALQLLQDQK